MNNTLLNIFGEKTKPTAHTRAHAQALTCGGGGSE